MEEETLRIAVYWTVKYS